MVGHGRASLPSNVSALVLSKKDPEAKQVHQHRKDSPMIFTVRSRERRPALSRKILPGS
jgi:hypothetical protein